MVPACPLDNTIDTDQSSFWSSGNLNWDEHRIGWAIAGGCTLLTVLISVVSVLRHCRSYTKPEEQRQILRILYMPPVYAIMSFFSYQYIRSYTYIALFRTVYQAITLNAFLLLLIQLVAATATGGDATRAMERKNKRPLPFPFCCWRYQPTKPYFMYTVKWSVLQYVILQPAVSIVGSVCQVYNVLCESGPDSTYFAKVYLNAVSFVITNIASYGLHLFHGLTKEELDGRRPLAKSLSIQLIDTFTNYQSFVLSALEGRVIKATEYWTESNVVDGLNALAICIEMVFFSVLMMWAFTVNEYKVAGCKKTSIWRPLWDSVNCWDFVTEIGSSLKFFFNYARGATLTREKKNHFGQAFGIDNRSVADGNCRSLIGETIRLAPYPYNDSHNASSAGPVLL